MVFAKPTETTRLFVYVLNKDTEGCKIVVRFVLKMTASFGDK